ncbi:hypothetical protein BWI93_24940 [Siphonobacter sp. BAB-5385]|uniref:hypothetical protein n=1 Tax=Siphonobacter sp. BAB-5385 TaxID=1864822 RepID=UPI000B9E278E|nr:hypothetical protein [Siphonobacter sp. BAB-5385]OZI05514.1 hypothetical protein BWI93_24940 [Siphonobacter sp. BAB-5385]
MTHTITIETQSDHDFALFKGLAQRLGLYTRESHGESLSKSETLTLLDRVAGSWEGDETGDELNAMIRRSRYDNPRDIEL